MKGLIRVMAAVAAGICICGATIPTPLRTLHFNHDVWDVVFSPDGRTVAVDVFDIPMPPGTKNSDGYPGAPPPGWTWSLQHYALWLCNPHTGRRVRRLPVGHLPVEFAFSADSRRLATSDGSAITLWDVATGARLRASRFPHTTKAFHLDSSGVTVITSDGLIGFWPASGGRVRPLFQLHEGDVFSAAFSRDGKLLATGGRWEAPRPRVRLWNVPHRKLLWQASGHTNAIDSIAISPDAKRVASGSWDGTVRIWDAASGALLHRLDCGGSNVWSVTFSPDSHKIADAGPDVRVWDAGTGRLLRIVHPSGMSVAFSPDGRTLAITVDRTVQLWR